jgi:hypothetical protein
MIWLKFISQIFLQYTLQQKRIEAAPEKIKGMSVQAGLYFTGLCFFLILSLASLIMTFSELGKQWDQGSGTHFSGPLLASLIQFGLGALVFGALVLFARYLAKKKPTDAPDTGTGPETPPIGPEINPLMIFGEEFLTQLLSKLK